MHFNSSISILSFTACAILFITLSACGGGGSDTIPYLPPTTSTPTTPVLPIDGYVGLTDKVSLSSANATEIAHHTTLMNDISNVLMFSGEYKFLRFDASVYNYLGVNLFECEQGNYVVDSTDDNSANVKFINCTSGPYTIDGSGTLEVTEFDSNGSVTQGYLDFTQLSINNEINNKEYSLTGRIELAFAETERGTYEVLIEDTNGETQYWLNSWLAGYDLSTPGGYFTSGRLFISNLGYVDVETVQFGVQDQLGNVLSPLRLMVSADRALWLEGTTGGYLLTALTADKNQSPRIMKALIYNDVLQLDFTATNTEPNAAIQNLSVSGSKNTVIELDAITSSDAELDILSYRWEVTLAPDNAEFSLAFADSSLAEVQFSNSGEYQITLYVSDGEYEHRIQHSFNVLKDAPELMIEGHLDEMPMGQDIELTLNVSNPIEDGPFDYSLHYGPASMQLSGDNKISWNGRIPDFGTDTQINYGVKVSNIDHEVIEKRSILLRTDKTKPEIFIGGFKNGSGSWSDVNGDGFPELLLIKGGIVEAWEFSGDNPTLLFTFMSEIERLDFVVFDEIEEVLIAKSNLGNVYEYNPATDRSRLLFNVPFTPFSEISAIITDLDGDGNRELVTNAQILDRITGEQLLLRERASVGISNVGLGDLDGDGLNELVVGKGIFEKNGYSLINQIEQQYNSSITSYAYDVDNDGKDELIVISQSVQVFDFENGQFVLKQTVYEESVTNSKLSFAASADFSQLFITSNFGGTITLFNLNSTGIYSLSESMDITDPGLFRLSFIQEQVTSCTLMQALPFETGLKLAVNCGDEYPVENGNHSDSVDHMSILTFGQSTEQLPRDFQLDFNYGFLAFIQPQNDGTFIVGSSAGVLTISADLQLSMVNKPVADTLRGNFLDYSQSTIVNGEPWGWDTQSSRNQTNSYIYGFDLFGEERAAKSIPQREIGISNRSIFKLNDHDIMMLDMHDKFHFMSLPDIEIINEIDINIGTIHVWRIFEYEGTQILAVWGSESLVLFNAENSKFSLIGEYELPITFAKSTDVKLMETKKVKGIQSLILLVETIENLTKVEFSLGEKTFAEKSDFITTNDSVFTDAKSCKNQINELSSIAYLHTSIIGVDEADVDNFDRLYKVVALDLATGEVIWVSRKLPGVKKANDIQCPIIGNDQSVILTTGEFLYLAK